MEDQVNAPELVPISKMSLILNNIGAIVRAANFGCRFVLLP
jgi:hypothetical protein